MNIKTGYKQTEIGVIPEDWDVKQLGDLFDFKNGLNKEKRYFGQGTPIVNYMDIYKYRGLSAKDILGMVTVSKEEIRNYSAQKGDVFFTRTSETVDEIGIASVILEDVSDTVFSGFILRARPKSEILDNQYKKYCFSTSSVRKEITSKSSYTTRALTNGRLLSQVKIPLPPLPEQTAIAAALSDVDALMGELDKLIAKKRDIKQATMQQLLTGKKRLAGFSGEWEVKRLGEVAEIIGGGTPSTFVSDYWNGNINWFTPTEIGTEKYVFDSVRKITKNGLANCSARILPIGTILLTSRAGIGDIGILKKEACTNQGFQSLVAKDGFYNEFLYYLVSTLKNVLMQNASGSTFLEISPNKIKQIQISIPNIEEQTAIATILSDMDAEINALQQKRDKTAQLKAGMMQELLTGRIRLPFQEI